jgi:hypothetical protein
VLALVLALVLELAPVLVLALVLVLVLEVELDVLYLDNYTPLLGSHTHMDRPPGHVTSR